MPNCNETPNFLRLHGDTRVSHMFGDVRSITRKWHPSGNERYMARVEFVNHLGLWLTVPSVRALSTGLYELLTALPITTVGDCSGAVVGLGGEL